MSRLHRKCLQINQDCSTNRPAPESTNCWRKMLFCKQDIHNFLALTRAIGLTCLNLVNDQEQINE